MNKSSRGFDRGIHELKMDPAIKACPVIFPTGSRGDVPVNLKLLIEVWYEVVGIVIRELFFNELHMSFLEVGNFFLWRILLTRSPATTA
jgi:hypothetical protein